MNRVRQLNGISHLGAHLGNFVERPCASSVSGIRVGAIATAAQDLVQKRSRWLNPEGVSLQELNQRTLTNLYNQRPAWLESAHRRLDEAVLDAYGWPRELTDDEILDRLLGLNHARARST